VACPNAVDVVSNPTMRVSSIAGILVYDFFMINSFL
jgi:hypothetical protein